MKSCFDRRWLAAAILFLTACNGGKNGPAVGAPGDDDDRPVTMIGTSLIIEWKDKQNWSAPSADVRRYKYSETAGGGSGATVNKVTYRYDPADADPPELELQRLDGQPLKITVDYFRALGSMGPDLAFVTDAGGQNLDILKLPGGVPFGSYKKLAERTRRHPARRGKIREIEFENVAVSAGTPASANCTVTGSTVKCKVNDLIGLVNIGASVEISVCKGTSCPKAKP